MVTRPEQLAWLRFAAGVAFVVALEVCLFVAGYVCDQRFYTLAGILALLSNWPLGASIELYFDRRRKLREQRWEREDQELRMVRAREDDRIRLTRAREDVVRP